MNREICFYCWRTNMGIPIVSIFANINDLYYNLAFRQRLVLPENICWSICISFTLWYSLKKNINYTVRIYDLGPKMELFLYLFFACYCNKYWKEIQYILKNNIRGTNASTFFSNTYHLTCIIYLFKRFQIILTFKTPFKK